MTLNLVSEIPPSVNHYLAYRAIMRNGKPLAMSYKTPEATRYQARFARYVAKHVKEQGWTLTPNQTKHFYVDCTLYFPPVDMDCNNYLKCMITAIPDTGTIWVSDTVVREGIAGA